MSDAGEFFGPTATAYAARVLPHVLRNWRRDGFFRYGVRRGKARYYSASEVGCLTLAALLCRHASLRFAFAYVRERERQISTATASPTLPDYVLTLPLDPDCSTGFAGGVSAPLGKLEFNVTAIVNDAIDRARHITAIEARS